MTFETLLTSTNPDTRVAQIVLNRPDRLNAFNDIMRRELREAVSSLAVDPAVHVMVLKGAGRAFSVGADVSQASAKLEGSERAYGAAKSPADDYEHLKSLTIAMCLAIWDAPVPVVVQIQGYCMGLATMLANCADIVMCGKSASIGWPRVPLGGGLISPTWSLTTNLHKAKEFSYNVGSRIDGSEAVRLGFANYAIEDDELDAATHDMATHMARLSKDLLSMKKAALNATYTRLGFEDNVRAGAVWDAVTHTTEIVHDTRQSILERGLKDTIADWLPPRTY